MDTHTIPIGKKRWIVTPLFLGTELKEEQQHQLDGILEPRQEEIQMQVEI